MFYNKSMNTKKYSVFNVPKIAEDLKEGLIVAFPTDTVFGLACVYDNSDAINKVKNAKGRSEKKPLPMMCSNIEMVKEVAELSKAAETLFKHFSPGAITLVLKKKPSVPDYVTNGFETIAIRIPDNEAILKTIELLGKPLLVTSANLSDEPSMKTYSEVFSKLNGRIDAIVCMDAKSEVASTIVDVTDGIKILRLGQISLDDIKEIVDVRS